MMENLLADFWEAPFYKEIAKLAHSQDKRVYQADPASQIAHTADLILGLAGLTMFLNVSPPKRDRKPQTATRRELLKKAAKIAVGASLASGSMTGDYLKGKIFGIKSWLNYGADDLLSYGNVEFRSLTIARGTERLCRQADEKVRSVALLHGAAHSEQIQAYIDHRILRGVKGALYLPYWLASDTSVREYEPRSNGWELSRRL